MANVKKVPDGYRTITPFFNIKGCEEAIEFYKKAFGAEVLHIFKIPSGQVMHAEIQIGDSRILLSDAMQNPATSSSTFLYVEDCDSWWKRATEAGCQVVTPLADQFWGDRWGLLSDRFGNRWGVGSRIEDVSQDEMRKRAEEAMKRMPAK